MEVISGFSKLTKTEKIDWLASQLEADDQKHFSDITRFWHADNIEQKIFDDFSENTISNFYFPFGIAPNFMINGEVYSVPMVIEESSVVAAASKSAKFWLSHGGFKARVVSTTKSGQVHFLWKGDFDKLSSFFSLKKAELLLAVAPLVKNMEARGGGITDLALRNKTDVLDDYFQLDVKFETCDAMGANFINSVLEGLAESLVILVSEHKQFVNFESKIEIIMSILTNYTPECIVNCSVECPVSGLDSISKDMTGEEFAHKFERAVKIAKVDVGRAVTHNKGIYNGIDSVILATGNDFRAIEACGHAYAARDGQYRGLSSCTVKNGIFKFELNIPLSLGTVGGLTSLHPLSKISLKLLGSPNASELMGIVSAVGLSQNFGALSSLVTTGIQKGHMKMHLLNILNQLGADKKQIASAKEYFNENTVSFSAVRDFLKTNKLQ